MASVGRQLVALLPEPTRLALRFQGAQAMNRSLSLSSHAVCRTASMSSGSMHRQITWAGMAMRPSFPRPFLRYFTDSSTPSKTESGPVQVPNVPPPGFVTSIQETRRLRERVGTNWFEYPVHNLETAQPEGTIKLATAVFEEPLRLDLLNRVVLWQRARWRLPANPSKNRAMVRGGGKKPWRQKGTGRARSGSTRSPVWKGGGKAHGPVKRSFAFAIQKKVRRLALRVALSARMREGKLWVVKEARLAEAKTRAYAALHTKFGWEHTLFVTEHDMDENFRLASRNVADLDVRAPMGCTVYGVLRRRELVLTVEAVEYLHKLLLRS